MKRPRPALTLDSLLNDPLTRLVMRSDNISAEDTARTFREAGLAVKVMADKRAPSFWSRVRPRQQG